MASQVEERPVVQDTNDRPYLLHTYRYYSISRRKIGDKAFCGDKALCGHIKSNPLHKEDVPIHLRVRCVVCGELTGRWSC